MDRELLDQAVHPYGVEGIGHKKEDRACEPLLAKVVYVCKQEPKIYIGGR